MIELRDHRILVDGRPVVVVAGEVHYFRLRRAEWSSRLDLLVEAGCSCVSSYIPWLFHELPDGSLDLTGRTRPERDLGAFVDLCAERGLTFLARPGPFVMAELKNEGLPYRLYTEHPEIVPVGWDGVPAPTRTVDYLAPAFLAEVEHWYAGVMPVLAARLQPAGGPVLAVQLDNEVGMLAWVSGSPDLTDHLLGELRRWCADRYGAGLAGRYPGVDDDGWAAAVRSPQETWAAALRVDLGWFLRERFARYVDVLAGLARRYGIDGVPFLVNIHGTEGGNGVPFALGVSQLYRSYAGRPGFAAGSDHYLGDLSAGVLADLHFIGATMAAVNGVDQPLTSLEFEAGTGDYGGGLEQLHDPATVDLKTRLCLAQGHRLVNYYLLAGGVNPPLDLPVGDGDDRLSFTGERHGSAAPIGPRGERGLTFAATAAVAAAVRTHGDWLADLDEEHDDVAVGFWPDAFLTEHTHPGSAVMRALVDDLTAHRGPGPRGALWRSLLLAGVRFGATDLQDPARRLPRTVALASGRVLDAAVQRRLADHVLGGGSLLLLGRLPQRDPEDRACTVLADALGLTPGVRSTDDASHHPSLVGHGAAAGLPETRVGWLDELVAPAGSPLFTDVEGRVCGATLTAGTGRAVVITAELPARPELVTALLTWLGSPPALRLRTDVPGVLALSGARPGGGRLLHLLNPTGYAATVRLDAGDPTGLLDQPLRLPPRTGWMLPLGLELPGLATVVASNAEVAEVGPDRVRFRPGLQDRTEVWLRTDRVVQASEVRTVDGSVVVSGPADADLLVRFGPARGLRPRSS
ncbi:beta-galactosidase [Friedmanniella luteola]|uniref:Beta-galactosidase n=1 Tax=Friedmanniella luteola TaxID=546871 RepID=A0A1H1SK71_9ACTN|nr:beta-galactosidase [Friedmanniella luteola]SDS48321.1 beta-galactosidase [Friedmanniella luteola]